MTGDLRAYRGLGELIDRARSGGRVLASVRPGQWHVGVVPTNVAACVESSLVVGLWDVEERLGGVCHFDVPMGGHYAMTALLEELEAAGCDRGRLRAKLLGGADARPGCTVGADNIAVAEELLATLDIPILARDTGGTRPRKVTLHTDDFSVWVWRI